jgi:hypothetical protein
MADEFDNLTQEQLQYLRDRADERLQGGNGAGAPQKATVRLPNGQSVTGTPQEIEAAFSNYAQSQSAPQPQPQVQNQATTQPAKTEWNYDTFVDKFKNDPREGLSYYNQAQYGFDPGQAVQNLYGAALEMYKEVQRLQAAEVRRQFPALNKQENYAAVEKVMKANNWQPSSQSLEQAYYMAKGQGLIKEEAPVRTGYVPATQQNSNFPNTFDDYSGSFAQTQPNQQQAPPFVQGNSGWSGGGSPDNFVEEFERKTQDTPTHELRGMLEAAIAQNFSHQR